MKGSLFPRSDTSCLLAFALCLIGLLIDFPKVASAQQNWTRQTSANGYALLGVHFTEASNGTAVGVQGTILRTTDGGATWTLQKSGVWDSLNDVFFTDSNTGTVVGDSGVILRTTDGGVTWKRQPSGTKVQLMGVSFVDANFGVVVGREGTILRTTDGGAHWASQTSGTYNDLTGVFCSDSTHGIAVGKRGTILRTTDGGATWKKQSSSTVVDLNAVSFSDANTGLAVGDDGIILRTTDGGQNWAIQPSGTSNPLEGVSLVGARYGIAVGSRTILRTTDGGATWSRLATGVLEYLQAVSFSGANGGVAVGMNGVILRATNGGGTDVASGSPEARLLLDQLLYEAVRDDQTEKVRELIQKGASPDGPGEVWPLLDAAAKGSVEMVRLLLDAGAGVDAMKKPNPGRSFPLTPLMTAAQRGHAEIIRLLVAAGAKVNASSPGNSALWWAAANHKAAAARALIEAGADLKAEIAFAEGRRWRDLVSKLREYGGKAPTPRTVSLEALVQKLDRLDSQRWSAPPFTENKEMPSAEEMAKARAELDARVKAHPDDIKALLLWARLTPAVVTEEKAGSSEPGGLMARVDHAPLHAALDRVLQAEPNNAEAHYRKGLLYGQPSEFYRMVELSPTSMDLAIKHIRKAVELAPKKASYRETLAVFLADAGKAGEGKAILTPVAGERHPMVALLTDLEAVGVPEGAEFLPRHVVSMFGQAALDELKKDDYLRLRLRTYRLSTTPESIEAFYRGRLPGFKFLVEGDKASGKQKEAASGEGRVFFQYLRFKDGAWMPGQKDADIPAPNAPQDGLMVLVVEIDRRLDEQIRRTSAEVAQPGQISLYLILLNYRKAK